MLLTLETTHQPATALGFLLHKHPAKCQSFSLSFGEAHVFYGEVSETCCRASLLLDVDPVGLVRRNRTAGWALSQYVNDRPYVASSFLSVAIAQVYGSALNGKCKQHPSLPETIMPLKATLSALPCSGGVGLLKRLFEPLGYEVTAEGSVLDDTFPVWGHSQIYTVTLTGKTRLQDLLRHLYVLMPVMDNDKHYWVAEDEVAKLLRNSKDWIAEHPEQVLILKRYLKHRGKLVSLAETLLPQVALDEQELSDPNLGMDTLEEHDTTEAEVEAPMRLHDQRIQTVYERLAKSGAQRVLDLGCGEGKLIKLLLRDGQFSEIVGVDVSARCLEIAEQRLKLDRMSEHERARLTLTQGSLVYRDKRIEGFDAAAVVEVIEHMDLSRLDAFAKVLFGYTRPHTVILTTPNAEYNAKFENLSAGRFRHKDHRFEWTRAEFDAWLKRQAEYFGYDYEVEPLGPVDEAFGAPSQMAVLTMRSRQTTEQGQEVSA